MATEKNEIFRNADGEDVGTGLWVPDSRQDVYTPLLQALETRIDKKDIAEILSDPRRKTARQRFPSKKYIKSQGSRGSCNGYACAKALERARVSRGMPHVPLSGEYVYAAINGGRDNGSGLAQGMQWLEKHGTVPEDLVPRLEYIWSRIPADAKSQEGRFLGLDCYGAPDEDNLSAGIALGFIAVVAVHFSGRMQQLDTNGVAGSSRGPGNHSVGADDLRIRKGRYEYDFFNSHGLSYGQEGKAWLTWDGHFSETTRYHQFFLIRSTSDDPKTDIKI